MKIEMPESKKLTGLIITLAALCIVLLIGVVAWAIWGVPETLFASIAGFIMGTGTAHQGAQTLADRSPYYQQPERGPAQGAVPPVSAPLAQPTATSRSAPPTPTSPLRQPP